MTSLPHARTGLQGAISLRFCSTSCAIPRTKQRSIRWAKRRPRRDLQRSQTQPDTPTAISSSSAASDPSTASERKLSLSPQLSIKPDWIPDYMQHWTTRHSMLSHYVSLYITCLLLALSLRLSLKVTDQLSTKPDWRPDYTQHWTSLSEYPSSLSSSESEN